MIWSISGSINNLEKKINSQINLFFPNKPNPFFRIKKRLILKILLISGLIRPSLDENPPMAPPQNKRSVCWMWRFCLQLLWANIHWKRALFFFLWKMTNFRLNVPGMQYELLVKIAEILIYIPRSYSSAESFWTSIKSHITAPIFIHDCPGGVCYICEFNLVLIQLQCRTRACDHIRVECAI